MRCVQCGQLGCVIAPAVRSYLANQLTPAVIEVGCWYTVQQRAMTGVVHTCVLYQGVVPKAGAVCGYICVF